MLNPDFYQFLGFKTSLNDILTTKTGLKRRFRVTLSTFLLNIMTISLKCQHFSKNIDYFTKNDGIKPVIFTKNVDLYRRS